MTLRSSLLARRREPLLPVHDRNETNARQGRDQPAPLHLREVGRLQVVGRLPTVPKMFQHLVEVLILFRRKEHCFHDPAVIEVQPPIGQTPRRFIVRHHHDRPPLRVKIAQQLEHDPLILRVEVARGLVREDDLRIVHQRPRDRHPLLFAARKLRGQMFRASLHPDLLQRLQSPGLIGQCCGRTAPA